MSTLLDRSYGGVSATDRADLRATLLEHRRARADQIEALLLLTETGVADVDPRELLVARAVLADIEATLQRLDDGSFGWCVRCTEPIGLPRLQAAPRTRLCIDCALEQ